MTMLHAARGLQVDQSYVDSQVAGATHLQALLDSTLIPSASDPELKHVLTTLRAMIAEHAKLAADAQNTFLEHSGPTSMASSGAKK